MEEKVKDILTLRNRSILVIILLSIFIFPCYFREEFIGSLGKINLLAILCIFMLLKINKKYINKSIFYLITCMGIYITFNNIVINGNALSTTINTLLIVVLPMYIISINIKDEQFELYIIKFIKVYNTFTIIIFIIGIIDLFTNYKIMTFIGEMCSNELSIFINEFTNTDIYRYTSYMGHPLFTRDIFIIFYILNNVYYIKFKKNIISKYIVIIVSLVGVLLTVSKSGIVIILICILIGRDELKLSKKLYSVLSIIILILITYRLGFFDSILNRLQDGTITSGRSEAQEILDYLGIYPIKIFSGYGEYISDLLKSYIDTWTITALLEYPIKILAYKYGIVCTIVGVIVLFIYPIISILINKEYKIAMLVFLTMININTYNGLIMKADNMILYCLILMIIINLSRVKINKFTYEVDRI